MDNVFGVKLNSRVLVVVSLAPVEPEVQLACVRTEFCVITVISMIMA